MQKNWKRRVQQVEPRIAARLIAEVLEKFITAGEPRDLKAAKTLLDQVRAALEGLTTVITGLNCIIPAEEPSRLKSISEAAEAAIADLLRSGEIIVPDEQPASRMESCTAQEFVLELLDCASQVRNLNDLESAKKQLRHIYSGLQVIVGVLGSAVTKKSIIPNYLDCVIMSRHGEDVLTDLLLTGHIVLQ